MTPEPTLAELIGEPPDPDPDADPQTEFIEWATARDNPLVHTDHTEEGESE